MRSQMRLLAPVCSKLQHTAAVFLQLAQTHVRPKASTNLGSKATRSSKQAISSRLDGPATEGLTDAALGQLDITSYLEWLPAAIDNTYRILEVERQDATDRHSGSTEGNNLREFPTRRPTSDRVFDWFSWDAYYAGIDS
ncbi:uncharacterized transcriptional regulatory protein C11D3.07c [Aspergillus lentulus]|nr:uncharacterized transcriptional regulatory protein C11D3.07c [Aspergillus lentulus]